MEKSTGQPAVVFQPRARTQPLDQACHGRDGHLRGVSQGAARGRRACNTMRRGQVLHARHAATVAQAATHDPFFPLTRLIAFKKYDRLHD